MNANDYEFFSNCEPCNVHYVMLATSKLRIGMRVDPLAYDVNGYLIPDLVAIYVHNVKQNFAAIIDAYHVYKSMG